MKGRTFFELFYTTDDAELLSNGETPHFYFGQAPTFEQAQTRITEALKIPQNQSGRTFYIVQVVRTQVESIRFSPAKLLLNISDANNDWNKVATEARQNLSETNKQ